jgi:diguanylate cyclase (GGDEF)-like protein
MLAIRADLAIADAHRAIAAAGLRGDALPRVAARIAAAAAGGSTAYFFPALNGRLAPVGVDPTGKPIARSVPSALDHHVWAIGRQISGNAPFGYMPRGSWLSCRCIVEGDVMGGLVVVGMRSLLDREGRQILEGIAAHVAALLRLRAALAETERLVATDHLTGLMSRLAFSDAIRRAALSREPRLLFVIDLDGFKAVNDTLGHDAGDHLLVRVGRTLQRVVRGSDIAARLGGDEFALIVEGTEDEASVVAERVEKAIGEITAGELRIGASVGYMPIGTDVDETFRAADRAMYQAKRNRRSSR